MATNVSDFLTNALNNNAQLQMAGYGRPGGGSFFGNLLNAAAYAGDFLKGVYSAPEGTPGILFGMGNLANRYNVRQFAQEQERLKRAQLANAMAAEMQHQQEMLRFGQASGLQGIGGTYQQVDPYTGRMMSYQGTTLKSEDMKNLTPNQANQAFNQGMQSIYQTGTPNDFGIASAAETRPVYDAVIGRVQKAMDTEETLSRLGGAYGGGFNRTPYGDSGAGRAGFIPLQPIVPTGQPGVPQLEPMTPQPQQRTFMGGIAQTLVDPPSIFQPVPDVGAIQEAVKQGETGRNNRDTNTLGEGRLAETTRSNKAREGIGWANARAHQTSANAAMINARKPPGGGSSNSALSDASKQQSMLINQLNVINKELEDILGKDSKTKQLRPLPTGSPQAARVQRLLGAKTQMEQKLYGGQASSNGSTSGTAGLSNSAQNFLNRYKPNGR